MNAANNYAQIAAADDDGTVTMLLVGLGRRSGEAAAQAPKRPPGVPVPIVHDGVAGPPVRRYAAAGVVVLTLALTGFGIWATAAPLSSAALAPGVVKVESNRKAVQHLEGGIIAEILVRDGDIVAEGQILARLDDVDTRAAYTALESELHALAAREARLIAQRDDRETVEYPDFLVLRRGNAAIADVIAGQDQIFHDRRRTLRTQIDLWGQRIVQYKSQISTYRTTLGTYAKQRKLLLEELADARLLFERGYSRKPLVLSLERQVGDKDSLITAADGNIAVLKEQIAQAEIEIVSLRNTYATAVSEELREVQTRRGRLEEQVRAAGARLHRSVVTAPQKGTVINLRYFAAGAVVPPGGAVMELVPVQDELVIEAMVRPLDIDTVRADMSATVRLVAYKQRTTPTLTGTVRRVSADAIKDERSGQTYFTATIGINQKELAKVPHVTLYPGMPVEVAILTGERTFLEYIAQPIGNSFARAFREE